VVKFNVDIDGKERQVDAAADGTLVIDGETFTAKVTGSTDDRRAVQVGDKTYEVRIAKRVEDEGGTPGGYVLEVAGERIPVIVSEVRKEYAEPGTSSAAAAVTSGPVAHPAGGAEDAKRAEADYRDGIFAPVPGKIVDVRVKPGDTVKEGDLVVILEAMKMENELHAPKQATVAAVLVHKGDQATKGQLLVAFQ
jgi:biotin carboxyl carrier protein